ncbi:MAG: helix-turn-helix transcriptional regulator [Dehalococcoidales bacterium]|nr:MAG: helix-turn-helix transcriptional regulator [Dehalococcoidales bacterium]
MQRGKKRSKQAAPGSFGEILRQLRESQQLTVSDLADKVGVKRSYITMLEEGDRKPSPKLIRNLAGALDVLPLYLKLTTGQVEFWDLYPVDIDQAPSGYSLSDISKEEEAKLLWFLHYLRTAGV